MRLLRSSLPPILALALLAVPATSFGRTFYVNPATGNDAFTQGAAQNPATPVKTVKRALNWAIGGDTVLVVVPSAPTPVTLADTQTIESKRDPAAGTSIVIRCQVAGLCVWTPPNGTNGFFISHNSHVLDGFKVVPGGLPVKTPVIGIRFGAHDGGDGPIFGGIIQNNIVENTSNNGIQCANCQGVEIAFNSVTGADQNGIRYQGNTSLIHHNTANNNAQFGIYVVDGVDHDVSANSASGNGAGQIQILGSLVVQQKTYYVSAVGGNDSRTPEQAQSQSTPWLTIQRGLNVAQRGDTVIVLPGVYAGAESRTDGEAGLPIVLRSSVPGGARIQAGPLTNALVINHNFHTVDGFEVTGSANGIQLGPHDVGDANVHGLIAINNVVHDNAVAGIKFAKVQGGAAMHNVVYANAAEGILYRGNNGILLNNLVHNNGLPGSGKYGMTIGSGSGHTVTNNTIHDNGVGGLRLGTGNDAPVFSIANNNVVTNNPVGVREPGGLSYTGQATLDFNNVHGNGVNYQLGPSVVGSNSISQPPLYVNAGADDFRLSRVDTGQGANSPCIDRGSGTADSLGLAGRSSFTDKAPDTGPVDLGYHPTLLRPSLGPVTVASLNMTFTQAVGGDTFSVSARLAPGNDSDGLGLGTEFVEIGFGSQVFALPVTGFTPQGPNSWVFAGTGSICPASLSPCTFVKNGNGSVDFTVNGTDLNITLMDGPITAHVRIGDDSGSSAVPVRGTLVYP